MDYISRTPRGVRGLKSIEDVDKYGAEMSHPSRGAWIEIVGLPDPPQPAQVAPLAGCVD